MNKKNWITYYLIAENNILYIKILKTNHDVVKNNNINNLIQIKVNHKYN